ncbi:LCP family glycopolymer transferase [Domibacillus tundrae]|uniref:LCP family glycopolymer transferase n=1 Tax=Domibacillus tundrae TaxID=1587527 RepID=UPI00339158CB
MKKLLFFTFLLFASILVIVVFTAERTLNSVAMPPSEKRAESVSLKKKDHFTVLLLGTDQREGDRGRTDTVVLASVSDKSIQLLSIPRDTRVQIAGSQNKTKINHAYSYGGTALTVKSVENFLNVPIDYFVNVNMEGFIQLIDKMGGVTVRNDFSFESDGSIFLKGNILLNGDDALKYVRMRYDDPNGDFGRQKRQQDVMRALLDKAVQLKHIDDLLSAVRNNVETNLKPSNFLYLQQNYNEARFQIDVLSIAGTGETIDNTYYYLVNEQERQRLSSLFHKHLNIIETAPEKKEISF